jgi:hypothetical protein
MRTRTILCLIAIAVLATAAVDASAKDLRGRFAIGFTNQLSPVTAASVKYTFPAKHPTVNIQVQAMAGFALFNARTSNDQFFAGARMLFTFLAEDNLNLYAGGGAGYVRFDDGTKAVRAQPLIGLEFFFFGLENLGFSAELGLNVDIGLSTAGVDIGTGAGPDAGSFGGIGIHYYF